MEYTILKTLAGHDMPQFQDQLNTILMELEDAGKKRVGVTVNTSAVAQPVPTRQGISMAVITVATALIEYEATEEEWNTWRAQEKFKIVKP
jgi:uncharacterized protein YaiE (UPF0345 family)